MATSTPLVVMTSGDAPSWALINLLRRAHGEFPILLEEPLDARNARKRERARFGWLRSASMAAAKLAMGLTRHGTDAIITRITDSYKLETTPPPRLSTIRNIGSVNSNAARETLRALNPKLVLVLSTRPLGKRTLDWIDAPFISFNPGIDPAYKGQFGAYFALARGEPELFGGTVQTLPKGTRPGEILFQSRVSPHPGDNIHTYTWRITACSRGIVLKAVRDGLAGALKPRQVNLPTRRFDTVPLGYYLWTGLTRRVW